MSVLLIAEVNGGAVALDATAKALSAAKALGPVTFAAPPISFMKRSMLSPTFAWRGVATRLVAASVSAAVRSLEIMAGFL